MKFRKDLQESNGPSHFIKLKDGESVSGILRGELNETFVLWEAGKSREVPEGTPGAKLRFKVNMVIKEGSSYVARILEGGQLMYKQLAQLAEDYELDATVIKVSRSGTGLDTEYAVIPAPPKAQVAKEAMAFIETLELHELGEKPAQSASGKVKNYAPGAGDDTPEF